jgi:hypothetical protein
MEQLSARHPFQQIKQTAVHRVDSVALLQPGQPVRAASRAAGIRAEAVLKNPRSVLLSVAALTVVYGGVSESLEKRAVHSAQPPSTFTAFQHSWHRYSAIADWVQAASQ